MFQNLNKYYSNINLPLPYECKTNIVLITNINKDAANLKTPVFFIFNFF